MALNGDIADVPGIAVGHAGDPVALTGCTVVLCEGGAVAGCDVRGAAPGTRETELLRPGFLVERVHGVVLSGGSAFGLDAASGVVRYLEERGVGHETGVSRVPIVPAAVIFDLAVGSPQVRPDAAMGYAACRAARGGPVEQGSAGAGLGASVGKLLGMAGAMRGGVGSASLRMDGGAVIGALAVVNALGDVRDPDGGRWLAGSRDPATGRPVDVERLLVSGWRPAGRGTGAGTHTTLGIVATDAGMDKAAAGRLAAMAQDGLARAVFPVHTQVDGDVVFALSTGRRGADLTAVGSLAALVLARAVANAVLKARPAAGLPAALSPDPEDRA